MKTNTTKAHGIATKAMSTFHRAWEELGKAADLHTTAHNEHRAKAEALRNAAAQATLDADDARANAESVIEQRNKIGALLGK